MVTKTQSDERARPQSPRIDLGNGPSPRILIVEARYYGDIADALLGGARDELQNQGVAFDCITVPGALEIPLALSSAVADGLFRFSGPDAKKPLAYAGALALGCVIRGETAHFDIVANNANHWLMDVAVRHNIPVGNAILTVENEAQALARTEGNDNKGAQAARACLSLIAVARQRASASS